MRAFYARIAAAALSVAGIVGGTFADDHPARPAEERAGYRVLQADFHSHTRFSDGVIGPCDLVLLGRRRGLDAVAVTEHNSVFPAAIARACAKLVPDAPIVVVGEEVTTKEMHLLALGVERDVDARASTKEIVDAVHAQGGVVVAAHPTRRFWAAFEGVCEDFDGIEIVHPLAYSGTSAIGPYSDILEFSRRDCWKDKAMIGNSDYHAASVLGLLRTYVFVEDASAAGIVDAVRARRTVTFAPDGTGYGPPELVAALERQPLSARPTSYGYEASSALDAVARFMGWLGLVGVVALRWPKRRSSAHESRDDGHRVDGRR